MTYIRHSKLVNFFLQLLNHLCLKTGMSTRTFEALTPIDNLDGTCTCISCFFFGSALLQLVSYEARFDICSDSLRFPQPMTKI